MNRQRVGLLEPLNFILADLIRSRFENPRSADQGDLIATEISMRRRDGAGAFGSCCSLANREREIPVRVKTILDDYEHYVTFSYNETGTVPICDTF